MIKIEKVSEIIKEIAQNQIMSKYKRLKSNEIECKTSIDDLVTVVDKKSEIELTKRLCSYLPSSKVLGEESVYNNPDILNLVDDEGYVWIIDPLDGTNNFTKGKEDFGLIISLLKNKEVVAGWIYTPLKGNMIMGELGSGVFKNNQKISLNHSNKPLSEFKIVYDFEYANLDKIVSSFDFLWCSAMEYQLLIESKVDAGFFCGSLKPWDHSAGIFLHREAGGYNAFLDGAPYQNHKVDLKNNPLLLAPNKEIWQDLQEKITYSFCSK